MARTVWGDATAVGTPGWVGDVKSYAGAYWASFEDDNGAPVMALDLADLAQRFTDGSFSVLGHAREALRLGSIKVSSAELESTVLSASPDVIDCVALGVPETDSSGQLQAALCLVLKEQTELNEGLIASLKKSIHMDHGEACVPEHLVQVAALPRTHNSKVMRNVVTQFFVTRSDDDVSELVSEISNPACLLELRATVNQWRAEQEMPVLDERC